MIEKKILVLPLNTYYSCDEKVRKVITFFFFVSYSKYNMREVRIFSNIQLLKGGLFEIYLYYFL